MNMFYNRFEKYEEIIKLTDRIYDTSKKYGGEFFKRKQALSESVRQLKKRCGSFKRFTSMSVFN